MRVHASLRDDIRLWGSAVTGAVVLFAVIVMLGIGPSRFPSFGTGHSQTNRTVFVPRDASSTVEPAHAPLSAPTTSHTLKPKRSAPTGGNDAVLAQPKSDPSTQRPTPSPVKPTQTPDRPAPAPVTEATVQPPDVPLPPPPDPISILPTLPPLSVPPLPPLPDPTDAVPAVTLP